MKEGEEEERKERNNREREEIKQMEREEGIDEGKRERGEGRKEE